ncbi:chemotaxis protein CheA [Poseidonibacter lekithochrous]|uniref:chemotaxis protein CheA n=1 Tax=Poseidonibacter lekithochrous TaxID=1904463 RepID=UPI0008FC3448|nr:chemotaxis protein CheA [Poseidonibacter lekithochrous]QKJ22677.1 chemotaxis sensory histidine kinase [Poseidonibacter lekithochrous]
MEEELTLFYEDATEQLQLMENALLDAKDGTDDIEKIGEIFRAMHTIKGTAGMFEFDNIVSFTHIAENLLDDVRCGNTKLDATLSSLFMNVKDNTQNMVECCVNNQDFSEELTSQTQNLQIELSSFLNEPITIDNQIIEVEEKAVSNEDELLWHISLRFDEDFFNSGMDIISIFRFFNKMGEILINIPITSSIPNLENINCFKTYIGFEFDFESDCSKDDILEIFEFVEDDVDLFVFKHNDIDSLLTLLTHRENENLKEVLIENCSYNEESFEIKQTPAIQEEIKQEIIEVKTPSTQVTINNETIKEESKANPEITNKSFSLRVDSSKVDLLINKMGEMVIQNAKLMQIAEQNADEDLEEVSEGISLLLEEIREAVMNIRMVQVKDSFVKFKRIVNDTAKKLGKDIDFIIEGGDTELDKSVVEKLSDPLVHMLRNSIDHGVEMPEVREQKGKKAKGTVYLRAYPDSGSIIIEIQDDGAGINKNIVLQKAIENGVVDKNHKLSDKQIYKLIFEAGLSTASEVSDISGRGVGMDVVKRNIEELRGVIDVDSSENKGSKITIRLPLTLAIIDGFLVQAGETKYIIPLDLISECMELTPECQTSIEGSSTINVRGEVLPLLDIRSFYNEKVIKEIRKNVVIVKYGNYKVGLQVDELFGGQQTVIKPLGEIFENVPGISGGSILGTGDVALIFDIPRLLEYRIKQGE